MSISGQERVNKRNHLCRPPRYPGNPEDYSYVPAHCRKRSSGSPRQKLSTKSIDNFVKKADQDHKEEVASDEARPKPTTGIDRVDIVLNILREQLIYQPEYMMFMYIQMKSPAIVEKYPDPETRWKKSDKAWKGPKLAGQTRIKRCVAHMLYS